MFCLNSVYVLLILCLWCVIRMCVYVHVSQNMAYFLFPSQFPHSHLFFPCRCLDRKTSPINFTRGSYRPHYGPAPWASQIAVSMSPPVTLRNQVSMCHILSWLCLLGESWHLEEKV